MTKSNYFSLNGKDLIKGLVIAILTPALLIIQQSLDAGIWTFNWKQIAMASVAGLVSYLMKNLLTNSDDKFLSKDEIIGGGNVPPNKDEK